MDPGFRRGAVESVAAIFKNARIPAQQTGRCALMVLRPESVQMVARSSPRVWAGILCLLALFAGSIVSALAGYSAQVAIYSDGERAIPGFVHGYLVFAVACVVAYLVFRRAYAAMVGSWVWGAFGLLLLVVAWPLLIVAANVGIDAPLPR